MLCLAGLVVREHQLDEGVRAVQPPPAAAVRRPSTILAAALASATATTAVAAATAVIMAAELFVAGMAAIATATAASR